MVSKKDAFSLIEVLIALTILVIGLLAIASLQVTSVRGNFFSNNLMQATYVAQDRLEYLKSLPFDDPLLSTGDHGDGTAIIPNIPGAGVAFNRAYRVGLDGNLIVVKYTVSWNDGTDHSISFSTFKSQ
jgi:type IV pilus assembly protein PilV